jgi:hypothetical protein
MSTSLAKVTMKDGVVKKLFYRIRNDGFVAPKKFRLVYKPYKVVSSRLFGVELELMLPNTYKPGLVRDAVKRVTGKECLVTGYDRNSMKAWKVETDNTIRAPDGMYGLELVSPILTGEGGIDHVRKIIQKLKQQGALVNDACGLHVHVDLKGVNLEGLKRICQNWIKNEDAFDVLLPPDRRASKNKYCLNVRSNMRFKNASNKAAHDLIGKQTTVKGLVRLMNVHPDNRNRYFKLNLQNLVAENPRNTIEFRGHGGTCSADEIEKWVRLVNAFVESPVRELKPFGDQMITDKDKVRRLSNVLGEIVASRE